MAFQTTPFLTNLSFQDISLKDLVHELHAL